MSRLTTAHSDDIIVNMDAVLVEKSKQVFSDGSIVEIVIWVVPTPVEGSKHLFKYRLYYGRDGERIVGFDNERGKGDHCHLDGVELPYMLTTTEKLLQDFRSEVIKRRQKP
ncbi:MAG: toxin-antitoxin system TumE family protein [Rhizobiaceae bacterium]